MNNNQQVAISKSISPEELFFEDKIIDVSLKNEEKTFHNNIIEPFINPKSLLGLLEVSAYHNSSIEFKTTILSQIEETNLDNFCDDAQELLETFVRNYEIFGHSAIIKVGTEKNFKLFPFEKGENLRLDKNKNLYEKAQNLTYKKFNGLYFRKSSAYSKYYGSPVYLDLLRKLIILDEINKFNEGFFKNNAIPKHIIFMKGLSNVSGVVENIKNFLSTFRGSKNNGKSAVVGTGKNNKDVEIDIKELNRIEDISWEKLYLQIRDEILVSHRIPPRILNIISQSQLGGNLEFYQQMQLLKITVINPLKNKIENFFNKNGIYLKIKEFDIESFKN
jgi:hypothetical protein